MVNLIDEYGYRLIENLDKNYVLSCIEQNHDVDSNLANTMKIKVNDTVIFFECISKYFVPKSKYAKFSDNSSCAFVRKAFGITCENGCNNCFKCCIENNIQIKRPKHCA